MQSRPRETRSSFSGLTWPPLLDGQAAAIASALRQFECTQWLPLDEIRQRQHEQLATLAEFCETYSPGFRQRLAAAGLTPAELAEPCNLARLPPLGRREVQDESVHCIEVPQDHLPLTQAKTSGSTGEPVAVRRTRISKLDWLAVTVREHLWHGREFGDRMAMIRAHVDTIEEAPDWGLPVTWLYETGPSLRIPIDTDTPVIARALLDFQPQSLLIYPTTLAALCEELMRTGAVLPGLRHLRTIGETLSDPIRREAEAMFGLKAVDTYSSQEIGYIALQCPHGAYHVMAEALIVEVVDKDGRPCNPGEIGRVLVTDLHNFATPLIRYEIGDYAEPGESCSCGRGLPTLRRIVGRERNLVLMPDGRRFWPRLGYKRYRDIAPISQYQLLQTAPLEIEARLVVERALTAAEEEALKAQIASALDDAFEIRLRYFAGRLPLGPNGKFEEFKCLVESPGL